MSRIIPIPKNKNTKKCEEYRPVKLLPKYEQILEQLVDFREKWDV